MSEVQNKYEDFLQSLIVAVSSKLTSDEDMQLLVDNFVASFIKPPVDRYSDDFFFDIIKPIITSLIRFKDDTAKEIRYLQELIAEKECANEGTDYAVEILGNVLNDVDYILADYDVESFRCEGSQFNPRRQNVTKKLIAEYTEQIKTVAESLSDGYERKGIVISKERVAAYAAGANTKEE